MKTVEKIIWVIALIAKIEFNICIKSFSYFQLFLIPRAIWLFFFTKEFFLDFQSGYLQSEVFLQYLLQPEFLRHAQNL